MVLAELDNSAKLFHRQLDVILCVENLGISKVEDMVLWLKHEHLLHAECGLCIPEFREVKKKDKAKNYKEKKDKVWLLDIVFRVQTRRSIRVLCAPNLAFPPWG